MKQTNDTATTRINREPMTWWEDVRFSLATWLMRVAVYVVAPVKKRENLSLMFALGATAYAEERERQAQDLPGVRFTPRPAQDLHRERERATGDSDAKDGA